jgi:peptidoglycan/xylan/chitin deacetylase (PgdA/CDA1 family)
MSATKLDTKILLTSWDDGLSTDLKLASVLKNASFKGTFYGTTGPSGRRELTDGEVEQIVAMGHEFGNHTWTHRPLTSLTRAEIIEEVRIGNEQVGRFMEPARILAPPRGLVNQSVIEVLREEGYLIRIARILGRETARPPIIDPTLQFFPHDRHRTVLHQLKHRTWPGWTVMRGWYGSGDLLQRLENIVQSDDAPRLLHIWGHSSELETATSACAPEAQRIPGGLWGLFERFLHVAAEAGYVGSTVGDYYRPDVAATSR